MHRATRAIAVNTHKIALIKTIILRCAQTKNTSKYKQYYFHWKSEQCFRQAFDHCILFVHLFQIHVHIIIDAQASKRYLHKSGGAKSMRIRAKCAKVQEVDIGRLSLGASALAPNRCIIVRKRPFF